MINGNDSEQIVSHGTEQLLDGKGGRVCGLLTKFLESNDDIGYKGAHLGGSDEDLHLLPLHGHFP